MIDDFDLIVSSFLSEYGIRIYSQDFKNMKWDEFCALLSGLSADSPLGRIVQIRAENDPNVLKKFTAHQRKIRSDWRNRAALNVTEKSRDEAVESIKNLFISLAGGVENGR